MTKGIVVKLKGKHTIHGDKVYYTNVCLGCGKDFETSDKAQLYGGCCLQQWKGYPTGLLAQAIGAIPLPSLPVKTPVPSDPRDQQSNCSITVLVDTSYDGYYLSFKGYKQRNPESNLRFIDFVEVYDLALRAVRE